MFVLLCHDFLSLRITCWSCSSLLPGGVYIDTPPKDIIVGEGEEAKFLCLTSVLPRSEGQEALITVHWKFLGQHLDVTDPDGAVKDSSEPAKILMAEPAGNGEEGRCWFLQNVISQCVQRSDFYHI